MNGIRRAIAIAGSLVVLLCGAQAIAGPILIQELLARALEKSHAPQSIADQMWKHLKAGEIADVVRILNVRAAEQRAGASGDGLVAAKAIDDAVTQLKKEKIDQAWTARMQHPGQELPDIRRLFAVLTDDQLKVIRPVEERSTDARSVRFALGSDVTRFARNYEQGGRNPRAYRQMMDAAKPDWFKSNAGEGKRIFLIGAGSDRRAISEIRAAWEQDGYSVFFYEDCLALFRALCNEGAVGAFMGTADHVFLCALPGAASSRYISVETDVAWLVRNGNQTMVVMVTPGDIFAPSASGTARAFILRNSASQ